MAAGTSSPQIISLGKERQIATIQIPGKKNPFDVILVEDCKVIEDGVIRRTRLAQVAMESVIFPDLTYNLSPLRRGRLRGHSLLTGPSLAWGDPQLHVQNNRGVYIEL